MARKNFWRRADGLILAEAEYQLRWMEKLWCCNHVLFFGLTFSRNTICYVRACFEHCFIKSWTIGSSPAHHSFPTNFSLEKLEVKGDTPPLETLWASYIIKDFVWLTFNVEPLSSHLRLCDFLHLPANSWTHSFFVCLPLRRSVNC